MSQDISVPAHLPPLTRCVHWQSIVKLRDTLLRSNKSYKTTWLPLFTPTVSCHIAGTVYLNLKPSFNCRLYPSGEPFFNFQIQTPAPFLFLSDSDHRSRTDHFPWIPIPPLFQVSLSLFRFHDILNLLVNLQFQMVAGKRRPAANLAMKNETDQPKPSASLAQSKPKRTFGRNLSGNITIERPSQKPITSKPWKPSGVSKKPLNPQKKVSSALPVAGGAKSGSGIKNQHVTFRELPPPSAADDLLPSTPVFSKDSSMQETPYQTAENCSKCRLDRLETSSYWLSQIKFAETSGKHFVSAAFFRLALDCKAQPFVSLQNELKHYRDRHVVIFMENLWGDLWLNYGLPSDQTAIVEQVDSKVTISEGGDCTDDTDKCAGYDVIEKPEANLDDLEAKINVPEEIVLAKRFDYGVRELSSSMDSPLRNIQKYENLNSNSVVRSNVARNKSKFGGLAINDPAADARVNKVNISAEKIAQAGTKNHGGGSVWKKETGDMLRSSDLFKKESKSEDQWTSTLQDEENLNGGQTEAFNQALGCSSSRAE